MNNSMKDTEKQSHLRFQMWDKHLNELNNIWDLEDMKTLVPDQEHPEQPKTRFHTTLWDQHLLALNQSWQVSAAYSPAPPSSLREKLLFPLKKLILRWVQPGFDALVQQQNTVIAQIVQTCNGLVKAVNEDAINRLEIQKEFNARLVRAFNRFVELVDSEFKSLEGRIDPRIKDLQMMVWTFDRRKEALEIDEILLNQKLERVLSMIRNLPQNAKHSDRELPIQERQKDYAYFLFENLYRGDETAIKERQTEYINYFQNCTNVLDIGCGRGEFLELLQEHDITGYGVDMNQTMVNYCRRKNLNVEETDIFVHLASLPDNSLDGIFTAQTIEHCPVQQLPQLLQLCFAKLQSQKYLVIETQNPTSLYALSHFYRDLSHEIPIHPEALEYLLKTAGFQETRIEYKAPFPGEHLLQELPTGEHSVTEADEALRADIETLNTNIRQLNDLLYGYLDYAVIARKMEVF